ncbi:MAG: hypothetical protein J2P17_33560 [Mycobacterium sp.]|nr:hypothetical protein [Mycobacterium sp.]
MGTHTHLLEYDGGVLVDEFSNAYLHDFANPLHRFNGEKPWALCLASLPHGMDYAEVRATAAGLTTYLQAAGSSPETIMVEVRKPGGQQWGMQSVRYAIGHSNNDGATADVAVKLPVNTYMINQHEVFDADETAELFWAYYKTGEIPSSYTLRPIEGYTADGAIVDLRDNTSA